MKGIFGLQLILNSFCALCLGSKTWLCLISSSCYTWAVSLDSSIGGEAAQARLCSIALNVVCLWAKMWSGLLFGGLFCVCFSPVVTQRHYRCELGARSVQGCCGNSARAGLLDQSVWRNLFQDLLETQWSSGEPSPGRSCHYRDR